MQAFKQQLGNVYCPTPICCASMPHYFLYLIVIYDILCNYLFSSHISCSIDFDADGRMTWRCWCSSWCHLLLLSCFDVANCFAGCIDCSRWCCYCERSCGFDLRLVSHLFDSDLNWLAHLTFLFCSKYLQKWNGSFILRWRDLARCNSFFLVASNYNKRPFVQNI